jgi:hypothetical protein
MNNTLKFSIDKYDLLNVEISNNNEHQDILINDIIFYNFDTTKQINIPAIDFVINDIQINIENIIFINYMGINISEKLFDNNLNNIVINSYNFLETDFNDLIVPITNSNFNFIEKNVFKFKRYYYDTLNYNWKINDTIITIKKLGKKILTDYDKNIQTLENISGINENIYYKIFDLLNNNKEYFRIFSNLQRESKLNNLLSDETND